MSNPNDLRQLARAKALTVELRALQDRMNQTVEQICAIVAGREFGAAASGGEAQVRAGFSPLWLQVAESHPVVVNPVSGQALGAEAAFYTDGRNAMLQVLQQPAARQADSSFAMVLNYSDFDGEWMSVVFDARPALLDLPVGRATLNLTVEVSGSPACTAQARVHLRSANQVIERRIDLKLNHVNTLQVDIEYLEPALISAFDIHLVFNPPARGSLVLRRLRAQIAVEPVGEAVDRAASVFEAMP